MTPPRILRDFPDKELLHLYWGEGRSFNGLGEALKCSSLTVSREFNRRGLIRRPRRIRLEDTHSKEELRSLFYRKGLTVREIANKFGVGIFAVRGAFHRTGIAEEEGYSQHWRRGERHPAWKGGRKKESAGYISILKPDHPRANNSGYIREHIVVWEEANGRPLPEGWAVHHVNGRKDDNRSVNLMAMPIKSHDRLPLYKAMKERIKQLEAEVEKLHAQQTLF